MSNSLTYSRSIDLQTVKSLLKLLLTIVLGYSAVYIIRRGPFEFLSRAGKAIKRSIQILAYLFVTFCILYTIFGQVRFDFIDVYTNGK